MARIDDNKVKMKATQRVQIQETTVEMEVSRMSYTMIMKMVEAKQKEALFHYLYIPLWTSLIFILGLAAVLLVFFQTWYLASGFAFFAAFSAYARSRFSEELKEIRKQLSTSLGPKPLEQHTQHELGMTPRPDAGGNK